MEIRYSDKSITSWGGLELLKRMLQKTGIQEKLQSLESLPKQGSNRGYDPVQLLISFILSIWCGGNRYSHLEIIRQDRVIQELFDWQQMAGYKSYQRYFNKFTQSINQEVFGQLYKWYFNNIEFNNYTLDFDSTIICRYGQQQGAKRGYNPKKPGRNSYHPLIAFVSDSRMVANFWLRSGNSTSSDNFFGFLEDTLENLGNKKAKLLRLDSGFYSKKIIEYLEQKQLNYIISVKNYRSIQRRISEIPKWLTIDEGIEISEFYYQGIEWDRPRRIIAVRQKIDLRPNATGKQLSLFTDDEFISQYRYSTYVTNMDLPATVIWGIYRMRADSENRIKELKEDFAIENFATKNFFAVEATLNFIMIAYNLMSLFRQIISKSSSQMQLKTLRYKIFATSAYITKNGKKKILNLCVAAKKRKWWDGLFLKLALFSFPFCFDL